MPIPQDSVSNPSAIFLKEEISQDRMSEYPLREYRERGFALERGLVSPSLCDTVVAEFLQHVKPYDGLLKRFTGEPDYHLRDEDGFMINALSKVHVIQEAALQSFKESCLGVLHSDHLKQRVISLLEEPYVLGECFYFEGNRETGAHQDQPFTPFNKIVGVWVALEDIHPSAGRLYLCPGSHLLGPIPRTEGIMYSHIIECKIKKGELEKVAPVMNKGDVIFFDGLTIHGALPTTEEGHSRNAVTGHNIPISEMKKY